MSRCVNCGSAREDHIPHNTVNICTGSAGKAGKVYQTMDLPAGKTCHNCHYVDHCVKLYGVKPENTTCDFFPVRFMERPL